MNWKQVYFLLITSLLPLGLFVSCSKPLGIVGPNSTNIFTPTFTATPSLTPYPTPHMTPVFDPPPSGIYCTAYINGHDTAIYELIAYLSVNGAPESTAGITITTPSYGSFPVTFEQNGAFGVPNLSTYWDYQIPSICNYEPGGVYTITFSTSIGAISASVTATGPITFAPDGSSATWSYGGNENYLQVQGPSGFTFLSNSYTENITSPFSIPPSAYPTSGNYNIFGASENTNHNITGADSGSFLSISNYAGIDLTK